MAKSNEFTAQHMAGTQKMCNEYIRKAQSQRGFRWAWVLISPLPQLHGTWMQI